jgi:phosphoglycolate phosphatase
VKHILWDWNGTLLDDTQAAFDTLNIMLRRRGASEITMDFYRDRFAFPVRPFYEAIGVKLEAEDWDALAVEYHDIYAAQPKKLNIETVAALSAVSAAGAWQSIISALRQDLLTAAVRDEYGLGGFFEYIYGVDNLDGASKLTRAKELVETLRRRGENDLTLIGDSLHDKEVADELGVKCVLCSQGSHAHWRLERVAPTSSTLLNAVRMALNDGLFHADLV